MRSVDQWRLQQPPISVGKPRPFPTDAIAFDVPKSNAEWTFFAMPLHSRCPKESIFYANRGPCHACLQELREHDPGDEDPIR